MEAKTEEQIKLLLGRRQSGVLHFRTAKLESLGIAQNDSDVLDSFVSILGFQKIGASWVELPRDYAQETLNKILQKDLAYQVPSMSAEDAGGVAAMFVECFEQGKFFSNGLWAGNNESSWQAITQATFDGGLIAFDQQFIAMIWVEDED